MSYTEIVKARIESLVALNSLTEFIAYNFYAEEITDDLVSAMTVMINEFLTDMAISNVKLEKIYMTQPEGYECIIPVMKFVWIDLEDVNMEHLEMERAIARIEHKQKYGR